MFCVKKSRTFGRICAGCFAGKSCTGFMQENHILHVGKLQGFSCHRALEVLFLFPMCRNGGVGINLLFLLCTVQALEAVNYWRFPSKCAFSALKSESAIFAKNKNHRKFQ